MRLLIVTQKVDQRDQVLGFMHRWILEFARRCARVTVICLEEGQHRLPANVKVLSLGKERAPSRLRYVLRFWYFILRERREYDAVFVHMNQIYILLGSPVWCLLGKRISLWYAHGAVSATLWLAEKMADLIFTSTASGFRLPSTKVRIVGQGIDTDLFTPFGNAPRLAPFRENSLTGFTPGTRPENLVLRIIMVGRLSPAKDQKTLIEALEILARSGEKFQADIVGEAGTPEQRSYADDLRLITDEKGLQQSIQFAGGIPHTEIVSYLQQADIFVNTGLTGSLDKAGLEAMAVGLPVLTCNEAYRDVLGRYGAMLMFRERDSRDLAEKLQWIMRLSRQERYGLGREMRAIASSHSIEGLAQKIISILATA